MKHWPECKNLIAGDKELKDTEDKLDDFIIRLLDNEIFIEELRGDLPKVNVTSAKQKVLKRIEESEQDVT